MKEQRISYETASLAHDKGFKYPVINTCPQSVLQKWLRDEHKIYVSPMFVGPDTNLFHYRLDAFSQTAEFGSWYESWEECLEAGLLAGLNLIN